MVEDSDEEDEDVEIVGKMEDVDEKDIKTLLSPEEAKYQGELADGVGRIKVLFKLTPYHRDRQLMNSSSSNANTLQSL